MDSTTTSPVQTEQSTVISTPASSPNKMVPIIALVVLLVIALGVYAMYSQRTPTEETMEMTPTTAVVPSESDMMIPSDSDNVLPTDKPSTMNPDETNTPAEKPENLKEFNISATEFKYSVTEIRVKKGDVVGINLMNDGKMPHDLVIDELFSKSKQLAPGQKEEMVVLASKAGTFEFYCSVGDHREKGMKGTIIVE